MGWPGCITLMLIPSCGNGALSRPSNTQPEPNASCVTHLVSRTLTTNHPSPAGSKPPGVSCSWASSVIHPPLVGPLVSLPVFSLTVIAGTGERFSDFAPYVASVDDA